MLGVKRPTPGSLIGNLIIEELQFLLLFIIYSLIIYSVCQVLSLGYRIECNRTWGSTFHVEDLSNITSSLPELSYVPNKRA